ncbi:MAG: alkaline phosphatase PhoX [Microthrixaceae bacterium]
MTGDAVDRRSFLTLGAVGAALLAVGCSRAPEATTRDDSLGPFGLLGEPDELGIQLPAGFTARVVARSSEPVPGTGYTWHTAPDGGACFARPGGGWTYVSNSETIAPLGAGVSALSFGVDGRVDGAYRILGNTNNNCGGGPTPWGTWLSCEENLFGQVYECDPSKPGQGIVRPTLGRFNHEAVAVDPVHGHLYLTEDAKDGRLYRFRPTSYPDLSGGVLEAAAVDGDRVTWVGPIDQNFPQSLGRPPGTTVFKGGEGCWYDAGAIYFTTKGDNRVWALQTESQRLRVLHRPERDPAGVLRGVDNVTVSPRGDVIVAEDGGNQELVLVTPEGAVVPLLRVTGQPDSELTGPAFSPDGTRLYFSSQRGPSGERTGTNGITYEVLGPFGG